MNIRQLSRADIDKIYRRQMQMKTKPIGYFPLGKHTAKWVRSIQTIPRTVRAWQKEMAAGIRRHEEIRQRQEVVALRLEKKRNKAYDKRMKMKKPHAIESLVRRKNSTYAKWRGEHDFAPVEVACVECMLRFGALPRWEEFVMASQRRDFTTMEQCQREHSVWRKDVREWALSQGITRFPTQSAQFLKFYFAWWRYEHEVRNGPIERKFGRQMG